MDKTEKRFKNNQPVADWFKNFVKRHPEITVRFSKNIKWVRARTSYDIINKFLVNNPRSVKVVVRRSSKHPERVIDTSERSISVMFAGAADGTVLPPYVVYKAKHITQHGLRKNYKGTAYNRNSSGWFDLIMFQD
ncbi:hypothetical protein NQ314_020247 [Rhamnusium bicolor]|uniref:Transposase n=1 Tax=Rhamnusium bicolor TaxID=1586634 RepID=A0AAV8WLN3_9CUCU|nr:hypothetical protein NQ314_020247 [Rhamnusium bicolor]